MEDLKDQERDEVSLCDAVQCARDRRGSSCEESEQLEDDRRDNADDQGDPLGRIHFNFKTLVGEMQYLACRKRFGKHQLQNDARDREQQEIDGLECDAAVGSGVDVIVFVDLVEPAHHGVGC